MEKLTALGTGYAVATKCFTTSFALTRENETLLIDTGGGNGILTQLERAGIDLASIHHIFLSHKHTDHIMGVIWLIRLIGHRLAKGGYEPPLHIWCHASLIEGVGDMCRFMLPGRLLPELGTRILFHAVTDGETAQLAYWPVTFFDTGSIKDIQYGLRITLEKGQTLVFLGDEPLHEAGVPYGQNADYLLHEAMCLYADSDLYQPVRIAHSSVKEACANAQRLNAKNLLLFHTEDEHLATRKQAYTAEAQTFFDGTVYVPDDLDAIILK